MKSRIQKKLSRPMHQARPESLGLKRGLAVLVLAALPLFLMSCGGDSKSKPALNAVAWGDDGFVAVGENGHILISSDGTDWKLIAGKAALPTLTSVVWTGELFIAAGGGGNTIWWASPEDWSTGTVGAENDIYGLTNSPQGVLAVGVGGVVFLTQDGVVWERIETGILETLRQVAWGDDKYVAVGEAGGIWTSADARTWVKAVLPEGEFTLLLTVGFGEGLFLASGAEGVILQSLGGEDWSQKSVFATQPIFGITAGQGIFILVGANGAVLQTVDGSRFYSSGVPGAEQLNGVTFGNEKFVTVGSDERIFASLDGVSWAEVHR